MQGLQLFQVILVVAGGGGAGAGIGGNGGTGGGGNECTRADGFILPYFYSDDGYEGEDCGNVSIGGKIILYAYGGMGGSSNSVENASTDSGSGGGGYPAAGIGGGGAGGRWRFTCRCRRWIFWGNS